MIVVGDVRQWIDRHRQDLLDRHLESRTIRGQWSTAKSRWVTTFGDGYYRWTPAQVERYAQSLEAIVGDAERDIPAVIHVLVTWPQLERAAQDRLCARARDGRPAVREKAIRVLARCDAGQGVATLLATVDPGPMPALGEAAMTPGQIVTSSIGRFQVDHDGARRAWIAPSTSPQRI